MTACKLLKILPDEVALSIFIIEAFLRGRVKFEGPDCHDLLATWIDAGVRDEGDLCAWLRQFYCEGAHYQKRFDQAVRWAEKRIAEGFWIAAWQDGAGFPKDCPKILFGSGRLNPNIRWLAIHNSRKSKLTRPNAEWLAALRQALMDDTLAAAGMASSFGSTTYDMLTAFAQQTDRPLCLVLPFPLEELMTNKPSASLLAGKNPQLVVTCQSPILRCSKAQRLFCRDHLLAHLADVNLALEIRSRGNLHTILLEQQAKHARRLIILQPTNMNPRNAGNFSLIHPVPATETFKLKGPPEASSIIAGARTPRCSGRSLPTREYWSHYLYHYTRACPGPWPGQSYRDYLLALLANELLCGHSALETLVRMLRERRVRASNRITRGNQPVISWSARPPSEMAAMRKWNPALIRWTFEPYGIAISKTLLRTFGAKPAIYGRDSIFSRLTSNDRFRYQRHEPPACAWKHEREWRSPGDLPLDESCRRHGFIFVDNDADAEYVARYAEIDLPILILSALRRTPGDHP